jgi:hypothetical protein
VNRSAFILQDAIAAWLRFWFEKPSITTLAVMRIGVGLVLFYSLFVHSFDLTSHFGPGAWGDLATLRRDDPIAWPMSLFDWVDAVWWLWVVHFTGMFVAGAFALGVFPLISGPLAVLFYLSYGHRNPAVVVDLDGLIVMSLIYLSVAPCARVLTVVPALAHTLLPPGRRPQPSPLDPDPLRSHWGAFMLRVMQVQLCLYYFWSGLSSMAPEWLSGDLLLHPSLLERGLPHGLDTFAGHSAWTVGVAQGLTVLSLLYPVLIWLPKFRYPLLVLTIVAHWFVGLYWGVLAYNMLMVVWNLVFLNSDVLEALRVRIAPLLALPWLPPPVSRR